MKILGIKEKQLPEIDDDFAQDTTEFDSLEEYKEDIKAKLAMGKEERAKSAMENDLLAQIVANTEMEIPEAMLETQIDRMVDEFRQRISYQGLTFEQYLQYSGQSMEALRESLRPDAEKRIQGSLVLEAIAAAEGIEVTDEDLQKELERMAAMYQMEPDQLSTYMQEEEKENIRENLAVQKAVDFILEHAEIEEPSEEIDFEE